MTQRNWYYFNTIATVNAGTPLATPQTIGIPTGDIWLESIRYYIPNGSSGLMGWYLAQGGVPIFPWAGNLQWIVEQNTTDEIDVQDEFQGNLQVIGYNTGQFNHAIRFRLKFQFLATAGSAQETLAVISPAAITTTNVTSLPPAPVGAVAPNSDGSCPVGYTIDPGGSETCIPIPPPPAGAVAPQPDGSCLPGYALDPAGSGYCVVTQPMDVGGQYPAADGSCPEGYALATDGSGLCVPLANLTQPVPASS